MDDREFTLIEHLTELRVRLVRATIGIVIVALGGFAVAEDFITILRLPLENALEDVSGGAAQFVVIAPAEYFIAQLKAAVVLGVFISMPWTLYQAWLFIAPGLYDHERRWVMGFVWAGAFFFTAGGAFAYFLVFPGMFRFFLKATLSADVAMTLSIAEHLSFSLKLLLAFGVVFQAPVLVFVLSMAGIVDPNTLGKYRTYVIVAGFVLGAILTPPDILSQALLAMPLVVLFEFGVLVSRIVLKFKGTPLKREKKAPPGTAADGQDPAWAQSATVDDGQTTDAPTAPSPKTDQDGSPKPDDG